ncbi:exopolysaccharide biosynthesis polyprenyl glycosylphosphotransferase [Bradyrhizobium guangdongense]
MGAATYDYESARALLSARGSALQRPFQFVIVAADFLLILLSYVVGASLRGTTVAAPADGSVGAGLFVGGVFVTVAYFHDVYATHRLLNLAWQLRKALLIWLMSLAVLAVVAFLLDSTDNLSRGTVLVFAAFGGTCLISLRVVWQAVFGTSFARSRLVDRKVILLSLRSLDLTSSRFKDLGRNGFDVVHHLVLGANCDDDHWQRAIRDVIRQSHTADVDEYLLAIDWNELPLLRKLAPFLRVLPQPIRLLPDDPIADLVARPFLPVSGTVAIEIQRPPLSIFERLQKRCLDVGVALFALVLLMPLVLTVAVLIKLDSPGPIIFRQSRRGFNGKPFEIWKFRTMTVCEDVATTRQPTKKGVRITRIGRFLRMTGIDALPQLWNVLLGNMSLVGPRPHALAHDNFYDELISKYVYRHHMKPGLTGWAQVNGFRGGIPTVDLMEKRVEYDVWYVGNWSIWLDLKIMARTASAVLFQEAY